MKTHKKSHLAIIATFAVGVFSCSEKSTKQAHDDVIALVK